MIDIVIKYATIKIKTIIGMEEDFYIGSVE
jgi:hypothetical protein